MRRVPTLSGVLCALLLAGCASGPVAPAWQGQAQAAAERYQRAHLEGAPRAAEAEFQRARAAVAATADAVLAPEPIPGTALFCRTPPCTPDLPLHRRAPAGRPLSSRAQPPTHRPLLPPGKDRPPRAPPARPSATAGRMARRPAHWPHAPGP